MKKEVLHDDGNIQWMVFGRDPSKANTVIDTNEYLIISNGQGMLLDPGGTEIFPAVLTAVSESIEVKNIMAYLCSHQDPDILSSLPLWMGLTPEAKIYLSWLWEGFVSHFGSEYSKNFIQIPDEGLLVPLGTAQLQLVPAHYLHSPGNFQLFDQNSGILFSGDVGSALLPLEASLFVEDFQKHIQYMDAFHRRWMPSNSAKEVWLNQVKKMDIKMICPQHGAIFKGEDVGRFLDWFGNLDVGKTKKAA